MSNLALLKEERTLNINRIINYQTRLSKNLPYNCKRLGDHERLRVKYFITISDESEKLVAIGGIDIVFCVNNFSLQKIFNSESMVQERTISSPPLARPLKL